MLLHKYLLDKLYKPKSKKFFIQIPLVIEREFMIYNYLRLKCNN